jgi:hypothetical protein
MSSQTTDAAQDNTPSVNPLRNHTTLDGDLSPFTRYKALGRVEHVSNKAREIDRQRYFPLAVAILRSDSTLLDGYQSV